MISYLIRKTIKNYDKIQDSSVRKGIGNLLSIVGIINNILLFAGKFIIGVLVQSISIQADAINNLSDAGSSFISFISFKLSSKPADEKHPFGHARYEYIASMAVAFLVLLLGFDLLKSSIDKVFHPQEVQFHVATIVILVFSIAVKLWMFLYNRKYGKLLQSSVMKATAADSLSDCMATGAVLCSTILSPILHFNLDGYMGSIVACLIMYTGIGILKEMLDSLLGTSPSQEEVQEIVDLIHQYDGVLGYHDLVIHDYGPGKRFGSVHVEVSATEDIFVTHDMVDNLERELQEKLQIQMVIHMDPIDTEDEKTNEMRLYVQKIVRDIHEDLSIHDFRMVSGKTHTNLIFDCLVPHRVPLTNQQILQQINQAIAKLPKPYYVRVTFDRAYISDRG